MGCQRTAAYPGIVHEFILFVCTYFIFLDVGYFFRLDGRLSIHFVSFFDLFHFSLRPYFLDFPKPPTQGPQ
jgi:hypothetical protein